MPKYSKRSKDRLNTAHSYLRAVFNVVIQVFDNTIICGHRIRAKQNAAFEGGKSKVKWPDGKHNKLPSDAVDSAPYNPEDRRINWPDPAVGAVIKKAHPDAGKYITVLCRWYHYGGFVLGVAFALGIKLRWGGDWDGDTILDDQKFNDLPHFELKEK
ncbi:hypothetical protein ES708_01516 [subsurface metagenome]